MPSSANQTTRGRSVAPAVIACLFIAGAARAALFPEPIHFVREVHDSISGTTRTLEEYCSGDRIVTIQGSLVAITDYGRGELTEIDRQAGTFSVTSFADLSRAHSPTPLARSSTNAGELRAAGTSLSRDGRSLEVYEVSHATGNEHVTISVAVDRALVLTASAVEALIGSAYPNRRGPVHDAMLRASRAAAVPQHTKSASVDGAAMVALPSEYALTYRVLAETVSYRSTITRIDRDLVPAEAAAIPPGSRRVDSRAVILRRLLDELDGRPPSPRR